MVQDFRESADKRSRESLLSQALESMALVLCREFRLRIDVKVKLGHWDQGPRAYKGSGVGCTMVFESTVPASPDGKVIKS